MANVVRLPYSNTSGNVPSTLGNGVLGINQASGSLYYRNSSGVVTLFTSSASLADGYVYDCGAYAAIAPAAPTGLSVTATTGQAALSWTAPTNNGGASLTDYFIQYSSNGGSSYTTFSHTASTATSATITGLSTGSYLFRVAAINSVGTGSYVTSSSTSITGSGGGATFSTFNSAWTAIGFTGSGTSASPYTKASVGGAVADGAQATVASSGTVRVTASSAHSDLDFVIYKNGTAAYTLSDNSGGNGYDGAVNATITVAAGDVIRIANSGDYTYFTSLNIWWQ